MIPVKCIIPAHGLTLGRIYHVKAVVYGNSYVLKEFPGKWFEFGFFDNVDKEEEKWADTKGRK
jgi:hypothetical protein